jgi:peptidoglycan/LPS O-acetylase OafA/YrhL
MSASLSASPDSPAAPAHGRYFRHIDSLRALAVIAVLASHYLPRNEWLGADLLGEGAAAGVRLFFALSGFLITGILLDARAAIRSGTTSAGAALGHFYARRSLRILPLYFLVVGACWLLGVAAVREAPGSFLTFTYNLHLIRQGWWDNHVAHFWTLSVEQQFYLLWPCLLLFAPRRALVPLAVLMMVTAEGARWHYQRTDPTGMAFYVSTLAAGDALGAGALLALVIRSPRACHWLERMLASPAMAAVGIIWIAGAWWHPALEPVLGFAANALRDAFELLVFAALIFGATRGFRGALASIAAWKPLAYLGRISYGIYVYHPLMLPVAAAIFALVGITADGEPEPARVAVALVLTLGTAAISWHLFEKPLNDLKRYF